MLVDAGLLFNSPFPPLLRPQRGVDLFLSFEFSQRELDASEPFSVSVITSVHRSLLVACSFYHITSHHDSMCSRDLDVLRAQRIMGTFFLSKGAFLLLLAYFGIGIVGISQTIIRSQATLIPEWL